MQVAFAASLSEFILYIHTHTHAKKSHLWAQRRTKSNSSFLFWFLFRKWGISQSHTLSTKKTSKRAEKRSTDKWEQRGDSLKEKEGIEGEMEVCYQAARLRSCSEIRKQTFLFLECRSHEGTVLYIYFPLFRINPLLLSLQRGAKIFPFFATFGDISTFSSYVHSADKRKLLFVWLRLCGCLPRIHIKYEQVNMKY